LTTRPERLKGTVSSAIDGTAKIVKLARRSKNVREEKADLNGSIFVFGEYKVCVGASARKFITSVYKRKDRCSTW
jgi:hypothetical protein